MPLAVGGFLPRRSSMQTVIGEPLSRDPLTDPRPGDRVCVRSGLVATVRAVKLGRPDSVEYVYADRDGTHFAAAAVSAWGSLCKGGRALEPEVQIGEGFDAVEVVR